jgi:hypothetical protein
MLMVTALAGGANGAADMTIARERSMETRNLGMFAPVIGFELSLAERMKSSNKMLYITQTTGPSDAMPRPRRICAGV